jgi:2-amino-4-hydroxy-6-hydroxymethyldihydropteridine diphosphokinase
LGSNRDDRKKKLENAIEMLKEKVGDPFACSAVYESEPWGFDDPTPFLNQVIGIRTDIRPEPLLDILLSMEAQLGRIRSFMNNVCGIDPTSNPLLKKQYESRIIDIDILLYGNKLIFTDNLMVPHPRLHERKFTLVPLNEIASGYIHPVLKKTIFALLNECPDKSVVKPVG